ncbi:MAG TPA: UMP kinase [Elusimicrobiota bacterium]|nr:UMP kinase [Elusimicrobiota bacterium]
MSKSRKGIRRVVFKLSGEALSGPRDSGIDLKTLFKFAHEIKSARSSNIQIAIVVGGGNIWRGARGQGLKLDRIFSDNMGMLATVINSLALQDALEQVGVPTRVLSAIEIAKVAEPFIRRRAVRHLEKGRIVIFGAGTGNPYFSTDTAAALRASEIEADILLKATQVDGVYDSDPHQNKSARRFKTLTLQEALQRRLAVMDATALSLCLQNRLPVRVFDLHKTGNVRRAVRGDDIGTLVVP